MGRGSLNSRQWPECDQKYQISNLIHYSIDPAALKAKLALEAAKGRIDPDAKDELEDLLEEEAALHRPKPRRFVELIRGRIGQRLR